VGACGLGYEQLTAATRSAPRTPRVPSADDSLRARAVPVTI
jgi:hypothetical protein